MRKISKSFVLLPLYIQTILQCVYGFGLDFAEGIHVSTTHQSVIEHHHHDAVSLFASPLPVFIDGLSLLGGISWRRG